MLTIMPILVSIMLGVSVFTLIWSLFRFPVPAEPPVHRKVARAMGAQARETIFEQPVAAPVMSLCLSLVRRLSVPKLRKRVRADLEASANPNNYSVEEYLALCMASGGGFACVSVLLLFQMQAFGLFWIPFMFLVGFYLPLYTLRSTAERRLTRISKQLPYTLDLTALMMGAGSTFTEAIATIIRDNPEEDLNKELRIVQVEIEFGTNRATALENMAQRVPSDSLRSVVGAINQAEHLGTPLSTILKTQSGMMRMHRSVRAEKMSASASLRILLPSMLILMAVVIVVFGPTIVRGLRGELWFFN